MYYLYIIFSKSADKYYVGSTHELAQRLIKHNEHNYQNAFSKIATDWEYSLSFQCDTKIQAHFLERFIKRMKSKKFIEKICANPQILQSILDNQFSP